MSERGIVEIDVELNSSKAEVQANQLGNKLGSQISKNVGSEAKKLSSATTQSINAIGDSITGYGIKYTKAVTVPIAAAAVATGASAVKIDTALTGVRKTVDGTEEQYKALKGAAIEFSKTNAVDPSQILDIQALGAQLGYSITELDKFGEVVSGLSISTDMDADTAAMELAAFSNIVNMSHDDVDRYGSTIVDLGNHFATTESEISHMAQRIAGAGSQIGMTEADILGMATALSSMGINAEAGGTAISTIMSNIDKAVSQGGEKLETWAKTARMSADEFAAAWKTNPVDALNAVLVGMDAATEEGGNMSLMLEELGISSIRQTDLFKRLANNTEMLPKAIKTANDAWEKNNALTKEVENRNSSMASRLEILKNKIQAAAIEAGEPLMNALLGIIDAADPLIEALASGAKAFADLDEGGQKAVLMAVGVVAAFGPVTTITGKVLSSLGKNTEAWAKFGQQLKATKTNIIASTDAVKKQAVEQTKYKTIMAGGQPLIVQYDKATKNLTVSSKANMAATKTQVTAVKALTTANKAGAVAMEIAGKAGKALGAALKTVAPVLAITVAIELFTALSSAITTSKEKAEQLTKATSGIKNSMDSYTNAFNNAKGSMDSAAKSADNYAGSIKNIGSAADDAIQKTAELADSLAESFADVGTNNAMVQTYADSIQNLTNKFDENGNAVKLDASEQAELIAAVNGLNSIMGTSYSVIDAQNGKLNVNTDEILKSAEAWQKRALMEAQSAASIDIMKRKLENETALTKAEKELTDAQIAYNEAAGSGIEDLTGYSDAVILAQQKVDDLTDVQNGLKEEQEDLNASVAKLSNELNTSVDFIKNYIDSTSQWSDALDNAEVDADSFIQKLSEMGVSAEDLARIMEEQGDEGIQQFIQAYQNGGDDLNNWLKEFGVDLGDTAKNAAEQTGNGWVDGLSDSEKQIVDAISGIVGVSNEEFQKMAEGAGISGQQAISALALAIADGTVNAQSSAEDVKAAVESKLSEMDGEAPAETVINQIESTFNAGADSTAEAAQNVVVADQSELDKIDGDSPAKKAINDWTGQLNRAVSISGNAARANATSANTGFNTVDGQTPGNKGVKQFFGAIELGKSKSRDAGKANADSAKSGFQSQDGNAGTWGSHLTQAFARGIGGAIDFVRNAANGIANTVKGILGHSIPKEGPLHNSGKGEAEWGKHLVQNIIQGVESEQSELAKAMRNTAQIVEDEFGNGILVEIDEQGRALAKGLVVGFEKEDPMAQIKQSLEKGASSLNIAAQLQSTGGNVNYNNYNQNVSFNQPIQTPADVTRMLRMQNRYGLAGAR